MRWPRRLRKAHHSAAYLATGLLVLMALAGIAASQILPMAERHPDAVARWLSARAGRPVHFDHLETRWTRRGPLLALQDLRLGEGERAVAIGDAEVLVSQYAGLLPGHSFTELRVRNLDLTLERGADGAWQVRGLPGQQRPGGDPFGALERLGELQVIGARLRILAPAIGLDARIPQAHLRMKVEGARVRAGLRAWARADGVPVDAVVDFDRGKGDGRAWFGAQGLRLASWSPLLRAAGLAAVDGGGSAQAWVRLKSHRVTEVQMQLGLRDLTLAGAPAAAGGAPARLGLPRLAGSLRWARTAEGWRLDTPLLLLGDGADAPRVQRLAVAGGTRRALVADRIDLAPLVAVAAASDRLQPSLREWLRQSRPHATLTDVRFAARGEALRLGGRIAQAGFGPVGQAPGVSGLGGVFDGDAQGVAFRFDPRSPLVFDWPWGFGVAHRVQLDGSVSGWREGAGWRTGTSALSVRAQAYSAKVRGGLWFQGDGTRPRIDLAADVGPSQVVAAKGFWLRNRMAPAAVQWLDRALQGGTVREGHAVVSGDLDDWPFRDHDGLFHAAARIEQATVKFQPDWPAAQHLDADVDFIADGFSVRGRAARLADVPVGAFDAGIERFGHAPLTVNATASADAGKLLALLRQSPLHKPYGETLDNLEASGRADARYALRLPPGAAGEAPQMHGTVALQDARLAEKRWDLRFDGVTGTARYDGGGFDADDLAVVHDGRPGRLALRAGAAVRDPRQAFEARLDTRLAAAELLRRAPSLDWLRPRIEGTSAWSIAVAVPKAAGERTPAAPSRLQLRSNLVGTALALPAPLDKPAAAALATTVDVDLPLGEGDVVLALGDRLALRARSRGDRTGVRVALGASRVDAAPPASGLAVAGRAGRLDAIDWSALTAGGGDGGGLALRSMDVQVDDLRLIGATFPGTRLRAAPGTGGTVVRLEGGALSGTVTLPQSQRATIVGRLARLHWRSAKPPTAATAAAAPAAAASPAPAADDDVDPARIPPLDLAVQDLRFGDAPLGNATLRTRPTAAGLRIVQLQTRAPGQSIDVGGDWIRTGTGPRTSLDARLHSDDFGTLLAGFGFGSQVEGGKGDAHLQASWPGSPAGFRATDLSGTLRLNVRDGQLVKVEPGAGRVLGLFGIAQLPRRLMLDFRDFFDKGFAFDKIGGDIAFGGGSARSDDLAIDGPAAEIRVRGAADLRQRTYDQTIEVYPRAGNLLTVAGAIAGGPVGAAIGAAANAVLRKPLGELAARTYRVTGPFADPKVETVAKGQPAPAQAARPPAEPAP